MNRKFLSLSVATVLVTGTLGAQTPNAPVVAPSPPPVMNSAPAPTPLPQTQTQTATATAAPAQTAPTQSGVTQIVYTPQLPNVTDLTNAAAAQGLTVERMVQTGTQLIAFYRNASGQATTVAYQTLPPSAVATAPVVTAPAPTTVVYAPAPRVIYYEDPYYYPRVWYPPVSLSFGFGYRGGYYGGGYYGGGHRHRR